MIVVDIVKNKKLQERTAMNFSEFFYLSLSKLKKLMPEIVKKFIRSVILVFNFDETPAPIIDQNLLNDCRLISNRDEMLKYLKKGSIAAEVGTLYGDFSRKILDECQPVKLHLLDIDFTNLREDVRNNPNTQLHQGMSFEILETFPDNYFDWVYIDGDHTYEGVKKDIQAAINKIKPGGLIIFNDFARILRTNLGTFGVHQAVCEFSKEYQWPFVYFCLQGQALYDVALRKPT